MNPRLVSALFLALAFLAGSFSAHAGPVGKGGFVIKKPGKYVLIRDLAVQPVVGLAQPVGIAILTSGVELDLAGFAIGPSPNQPGVGIGIWLAKGVQRVRVQNGRLHTLASGLRSDPAGANFECVFERLQVASCTGTAVVLRGGANAIRGCMVTNVPTAQQGIVIQGQFDLGNEVSDCTLVLGGAAGIVTNQSAGLLVRRCFVSNFTIAFAVNSGCKLLDNVTAACGTKFTGNPVLLGVND